MEQTKPYKQQTDEEARALFWKFYGEKYIAVIGPELGWSESEAEQIRAAAISGGGERYEFADVIDEPIVSRECTTPFVRKVDARRMWMSFAAGVETDQRRFLSSEQSSDGYGLRPGTHGDVSLADGVVSRGHTPLWFHHASPGTLRRRKNWTKFYGVSEQRFDPAAVNRDRAAGDVARTLRDKKRGEGGEFGRFAETPHRDLGRPACLDLVGGQAFLVREKFDQFLEPFGAGVAGQNVIHSDAVSRDLARERFGKTGDRRSQAV